MSPVVQIKDLSISFVQEGASSPAVNNISFDIPAGEITAVIGESGSGKSVTALSFMQLLPLNAVVKGQLIYTEKNYSADLAQLSTHDIQKLRGNRIAMIFQEPMTSLNPVHTCGDQVMESLMLHKKLTKQQAKIKTVELFKKVELPSPEQMLKRYPHQISGGQKQRVMIAMAMSCDPALLIADEPTTALDVRVQKNILSLLKKLQQETGMAILFISHDLSLVADIADTIVVMYKGDVVEKGKASEVLREPEHPYTKALLACKPSVASKGKRLPVVSEVMNGELQKETFVHQQPVLGNETDVVLKVENLTVSFSPSKNIFGKVISEFKAVDDVSFSVNRNETVGLVGESGCGKTTLGRAILQLVKPSAGKIIFEGKDIAACSQKDMRIIRKDLQIVFQDPYGSLNPRLTIGEAIAEPMKVHFPDLRKHQRKEKAIALLEQVDMKADAFHGYPHRFSGGQRQRICIARALALNPDFLIFDESVSALDVSVQAQVLNLINDLKAAYNFTSIFISHDLAVVQYISDRIMVMKAGRIIEEGRADAIFSAPKENYTKALLDAVPGKKVF